MPFLLTRIKVAEYDTWQRTFEEYTGTRRANGSIDSRVFRNGTDPEDVWVLLEWDDLLRARLFANSDDMIDELIRAGFHFSRTFGSWKRRISPCTDSPRSSVLRGGCS